MKDGYKDNQIKGFKRTHYPWLYEVPEEFAGKIKLPHIDLDLYPKLEAMGSQDNTGPVPEGNIRHKGKIASTTMALFDFDRDLPGESRNSNSFAVGAIYVLIEIG